MSLATPMVFDNSAARQMLPGDVLFSNESIQTVTNAAGVTYTAQNVLTSLLTRASAGVGQTDTTPDANTWINAMLQNTYLGAGAITPLGVQVGATYRIRIMNSAANAITLAGGTNVSLVAGPAGTTNLAANTFSEFLVSVLNGTPQQVFAATTTNGSAVITGLSAAQTALLSPGMAVSGTGIAGGSTVLSVQPGVGVTLSANATATGALVALTFAPRISMTKLN